MTARRSCYDLGATPIHGHQVSHSTIENACFRGHAERHCGDALPSLNEEHMARSTGRCTGVEHDFQEVAQTFDTRFLLAIIHGDVDVVHVAKRELVNRGLDRHGRWVGFQRSTDMHIEGII